MCSKRSLALWLALLATRVAAAPIPAIAYHDIVEQRGADEFAVTVAEFQQQMEYLHDEGYTPISLRQLDAAHRGVATLPHKPVLLSFDDGLASFEHYALPVLRNYGYPVLLAVVSAWVDGRAAPEHYSGRLLSWDALRQIAARGDVEIISHSDNLHRGLRSNPQGNLAPAGITREYSAQGRYESEAEFRQRVRADLTHARQRLLTNLKHAPLAIAWPYGQCDAILIEEAAKLGMTYHLTLEDSPSQLEDLPRINRTTFYRYRRLADFDNMLTLHKWHRQQQRFVEVALDEFAGLTPKAQEQRLSALLARLELLRVNGVIVRPFSHDTTKAFFPNPRVPLATEMLNRVLHQIRARLHVDHLYLRLPVLPDAKTRSAVYRELARLNRFSGIMVEGTPPIAEASALVALFRRYNPTVQIGFSVDALQPAGADFVWTEFAATDPAAIIEKRATAVLAGGGRVLFVLQRPSELVDAQLVAAMQALRRAGALHYGYSNDEFIGDRPALTSISRELNAHVITDKETH